MCSGRSINFAQALEDNVSASSSFIANAHNELSCGKRRLIEKNSEPVRDGCPHCPFESTTDNVVSYLVLVIVGETCFLL